jgi:hypothetical protein
LYFLPNLTKVAQSTFVRLPTHLPTFPNLKEKNPWWWLGRWDLKRVDLGSNPLVRRWKPCGPSNIELDLGVQWLVESRVFISKLVDSTFGEFFQNFGKFVRIYTMKRSLHIFFKIFYVTKKKTLFRSGKCDFFNKY